MQVERDDGNLTIDLNDLDLGSEGHDPVYSINIESLLDRWAEACASNGEAEDNSCSNINSGGNSNSSSSSSSSSWDSPKPPSEAITSMLSSLLEDFPEHGRKAYAAVIYLFVSILSR